MAIEFVDHSPVRIACRLATGPYEELNLGYRALFEDLSRLVGQQGITGVYGIPVDDPREVAPAEHRFICAMSVDGGHNLGAGAVETRDIGGGRCARLRHHGPYSEIPATLDALYAELIEGGHDPADRETFIHYVDQPSAAEGAEVPHVSDIYVPVG